MNLRCTSCNREINSENINITTDLAKCGKCGAIHKVSLLVNPVKKEDLNPPIGSKIIMKKGINGNIIFTYPKKGFSRSLIPQLFFTTVWLSFITFWTWGASQGSIIFALFSIPFWFVGINMLAGILNEATELQTITINKYKLSVKRQRAIRPQFFETDLKNIQSVKLKGLKKNGLSMFGNVRHMMKMQRSFGSPIELPAIITGLKTEYFFDEANDAEQEWVISVLDSLVKKGIKR